MNLDELFQPIVDALVTTELGAPKTQAVIRQHLEIFQMLQKQGLTYKQIATGLNDRGARGRTGAKFTPGTLSNFIKRAQASRSSGRAGVGDRLTQNTGRPAASPEAPGSSTSPELSKFNQRIREARSHAATTEILFSKRRPR